MEIIEELSPFLVYKNKVFYTSPAIADTKC